MLVVIKKSKFLHLLLIALCITSCSTDNKADESTIVKSIKESYLLIYGSDIHYSAEVINEDANPLMYNEPVYNNFKELDDLSWSLKKNFSIGMKSYIDNQKLSAKVINESNLAFTKMDSIFNHLFSDYKEANYFENRNELNILPSNNFNEHMTELEFSHKMLDIRIIYSNGIKEVVSLYGIKR